MSYGPPPPHGYGQPSGYGQPHGSGQPAGPPRTETKAIVALVLAVLAYSPVSFISAIAALFVARAARRDIAASGGALTGSSLCTWAVVLSWVHLAFVGLLAALLVLGFALFSLPFGLR